MTARPTLAGFGAAPAIGIYWAAVAVLLNAGLARSEGRLVYPLDDAYVHMAMAKHAALSGVWGVTAEQFTSASSSPLWTGLLAAVYYVFGVFDSTPLILNILIGTELVASLHRLLRSAGVSLTTAAVATVALTLLGAVPTLTLLGMEHTLHALLTIWFVTLGVRLSMRSDQVSSWWPVAALAALLTLTRYEGAFAVACVSVVLALAGRWRASVAVAVAGALPIILYGLWSQSQGGFLLPNSVLLKGVAPAMTLAGVLQLVVFWPALVALTVNPHLAFLVIAALGLAAVVRPSTAPPHGVWLALVFVACTLLHLQFARAGWFYRYEAYLVMLGLVTVVMLAAEVEWAALVPPRGLAISAGVVAVLAVILAFPIARRAANAWRQTPTAVSNIFEQQFQAGLFLDQFYRGQRVAVNDVGAIGYLADVRLLDVWGLASRETATLKRQGAYTSAALEQLATRQAAEIAIIYPSWLGEYGGVPASWQKVGEWRVADNVVLGENGMSFYSLTAGARDRLIANLVQYSAALPAGVIQEGLYLAPAR